MEVTSLDRLGTPFDNAQDDEKIATPLDNGQDDEKIATLLVMVSLSNHR